VLSKKAHKQLSCLSAIPEDWLAEALSCWG